MGRVFVTGALSPGKMYVIDPTHPAGTVAAVSGLGDFPAGIGFDGNKIWTANTSGSISILSPVTSNTFSITTVTQGFSSPYSVVFDGANIWITDVGDNTLKKLDSGGGIIQTVPMGSFPRSPAFDGTNIWVVNGFSNTVIVVRASTGTIVATLNGNLSPGGAAFDGERILVCDQSVGTNLLLYKASDLTLIGAFSAGPGTEVFDVCSDGINFWLTLSSGKLARF